MLRLREEVIRMGAFRAEWLPASELPHRSRLSRYVRVKCLRHVWQMLDVSA